VYNDVYPYLCGCISGRRGVFFFSCMLWRHIFKVKVCKRLATQKVNYNRPDNISLFNQWHVTDSICRLRNKQGEWRIFPTFIFIINSKKIWPWKVGYFHNHSCYWLPFTRLYLNNNCISNGATSAVLRLLFHAYQVNPNYTYSLPNASRSWSNVIISILV